MSFQFSRTYLICHILDESFLPFHPVWTPLPLTPLLPPIIFCSTLKFLIFLSKYNDGSTEERHFTLVFNHDPPPLTDFLIFSSILLKIIVSKFYSQIIYLKKHLLRANWVPNTPRSWGCGSEENKWIKKKKKKKRSAIVDPIFYSGGLDSKYISDGEKCHTDYAMAGKGKCSGDRVQVYVEYSGKD
jgi:hypothetical protein